MQRQARLSLAAAVIFGSNGALAQDGDLAGVTLRVLDDLSDVDAVVLDLDANRGESDEGAASDDAAGRDGAEDEERNRDAADRDGAVEAAAAEARRAERRERDALHDADADERGEGRLEDRDVERLAVPPATAP